MFFLIWHLNALRFPWADKITNWFDFSTVAKHSTLSPPREEDKNMLSGKTESPTPSRKSDRTSDSQGQQSKFSHLKGVVSGEET